MNLKTSNVIGAVLRGAIVGVALVALFWLLRLPLDPKLGVVLFAVSLYIGFISCYERAPRLAPAQPAAEIIMPRVSWRFTATAPEQLTEFIEMVGAEQFKAENWTPEEPVDESGPITVEFEPYWDEDAETPTRLTLAKHAGGQWTHGTLLYALHHAVEDSVDLGDHCYFEGLRMLEPGRYYLHLGS